MKLTFHGGAKEVGRSCIEVQTSKARFLLDAGVKLGEETQYPEEISKVRDIDAVFLSHPHLDHCGAFPYFQNKGLRCSIYTTPVTRDLVKLLLKDFYKVESLNHIPSYPKESIFRAFDLFRNINQNQKLEIKNAYIKFFDSGHVPGASSIYIESDGKQLFYSGDIRLSETRLMNGADIQLRDVDALIMETTYGNKEHPDRKKTEREFIDKVKETLKRGGKVFIPAFSVGRTQELILLLHSEKWNVPVYVDGMGSTMTDMILQHQACKDVKKLQEAVNKTKFVHGSEQREKAMQKQGIFVASAGMMTGGAIINYLKEGHQDPKNSILITGYVDAGTNGRLLLDEGSIFIEGRKTKVKAEYHQYDFSAHAGLDELKELVVNINPKKIILVHGETDSLESFADYLRKKGKEVYIPGIGDIINI